jgi:hypothetical protein
MKRQTLSFSALILFLVLARISLFAGETNMDLVKSAVLEKTVAYLHIGQVQTGLAEQISAAEIALAATNHIAGIVLDLRFANGDDLTAAKATADVLTQKRLPLVILVNGQTSGAAAELAAALRTGREGLVLGGATGELKPDIAVMVKPADEKQFIQNPYAALALSGTNSSTATNDDLAAFIDHTSEADLVREKIKDGDQDADSVPPHPTEPSKPYIHDPVLARAVDLIKALAELRQTHA